MKKLLSFVLSCLMAVAMSAQTVEDATYGTLDFGIDGFAAYEGNTGAWYHAGGTTGGAGGDVVTAEDFSQLQAYLQSSKPYIILVTKDIATSKVCYIDKSAAKNNICEKQDGTEGTATTFGERIMVASNKTLIGVADAQGNVPLISRITLVMQCVHNIIIRNLRFTMLEVPVIYSKENKIVAWREGEQKMLNSDPDCIGIQADAVSAKKDSGGHIWIDHCEFFNGDTNSKDRYDGLIDCKNNVQWMTFSYNLFHDHCKSCLWGKGDSDIFDNCRTISAHHNWFKHVQSPDGKQGSRLPLQRGGSVHYMNNYQNECLDGWDLRAQAVSYVDACYFKDCKAPILPDGNEGAKLTVNKEEGYGIIYDNCRRIITSPTDGITYLNTPSKLDAEYNLADYDAIGTWKPTDTWSGYSVNNRVKAEQVPDFCEKYSGAGKIEIWKEYASEVPAYSQTNLQAALDTPWVLTKASGTETFYTYDAQGNKMTVAPAPTAVENINGNVNWNANKVQKAIVDGKLIITKDGKQFNAAGAQVQ